MVCPRCASMYVKKDGIKKKKKGLSQQYKCKSCSRYFSVPIETEVKEYEEVSPGQVFNMNQIRLLEFMG